MVGWLFLNNPARLAELFDHLEQADPTHNVASHTMSPRLNAAPAAHPAMAVRGPVGVDAVWR